MRKRVLLSWSSGKDSAWTLHRLRQRPDVELTGLLTTVNATHDRVAMHATRRAILEAQARAAGLPLRVIELSWPCSDEIYEARMLAAVEAARVDGITHIAFGDLFLEDIRDYRCRQLAGTGLEPLFPIWHEPTDALARRIVDAGVEAYITCVDPARLPARFAGRRFDHGFLDELPAACSPARCSAIGWRPPPARGSNATASASRIWCRPRYSPPRRPISSPGSRASRDPPG